jgi:hypothetical protein
MSYSWKNAFTVSAQNGHNEHFFALPVLFRDDIINIHKQHQWAEENPHGLISSKHQQQFSINAWAGIVGDR